MRIIVTGYIVGYPLGGMTWHHLNYLLGFAELGHEVIFYEDSGEWLQPYDPSNNTCSDDPSYGIGYLTETFAFEGLNAKWCYHSQLQNRYYGLSRDEWMKVVDGADLVLCVSGVTPWREEFAKAKRTCVIDTDPVFTQLRMRHDESFLNYYKLFDRVATFGRLIGTPDCPLPTAGLEWIGTNQPIAMPHWPFSAPPLEGGVGGGVTGLGQATREFQATPHPALPLKGGGGSPFSTIGKWEHTSDRNFEYEGKSYASSKGVEWMKLLDLPRRVSLPMEMAMASMPEETKRTFESHGWRFTDPTLASISTNAYRAFIQSRAGEFTVAKQIYAGLPSGWFSDRSAAFLASGRPVITQSSGFEKWLPTGEGLFSFATIDDAQAALDAVASDPSKHAHAARAIAEEHFDARRVLTRLLDALA